MIGLWIELGALIKSYGGDGRLRFLLGDFGGVG